MRVAHETERAYIEIGLGAEKDVFEVNQFGLSIVAGDFGYEITLSRKRYSQGSLRNKLIIIIQRPGQYIF